MGEQALQLTFLSPSKFKTRNADQTPFVLISCWKNDVRGITAFLIYFYGLLTIFPTPSIHWAVSEEKFETAHYHRLTSKAQFV